jgi:hypothetical protein
MSNESPYNTLLSKNNEAMIHSIFYGNKVSDVNAGEEYSLQLEKKYRAFNKEEDKFVNRTPDTEDEYKGILNFMKKEEELLFRFVKISDYYSDYFNDEYKKKLRTLKNILTGSLIVSGMSLIYISVKRFTFKKSLGIIIFTTFGILITVAEKQKIIFKAYNSLFSYNSQKEVEDKITFLETNNLI